MEYQTSQKTPPHVRIEAQGRLLKVVSVGVKDGPIIRTRGDVTGFTHNSRMRLLRKFHRIHAPDSPGYRSNVSFLTLTTKYHFHPRVFKAMAQKLFKRISRKYARLSLVWRLEFQKRGAPHMHCVLYNAPWIDRSWLVAAWSEVVEEPKPVVDIRRVKTGRQLISYVSKYVAKVGDASLLDIGTKNAGSKNFLPGMKDNCGRLWGVWNADCLPFAELEEGFVPLDGSWWMIRRYCQKFYSSIWDDDMAGFTVFVDDPYHALKHIVKLAESFGAYTIAV